MRWLGWLLAFDPDDQEPFPSEVTELPSDLTDAQLDFVEREARSAQAREEDRERGVQARLIALLGLASLVVAVLSGAAAFATTNDLRMAALQLSILLLTLAYVAMQAVATMLFTIKGLMPKSYYAAQPWDGRVGDRSDRLSQHITNLRRSMWSTNRRVEHMVLALRSLKRFAWGSAVLLAVLVVVALDRQHGLVSNLLDSLHQASLP